MMDRLTATHVIRKLRTISGSGKMGDPILLHSCTGVRLAVIKKIAITSKKHMPCIARNLT